MSPGRRSIWVQLLTAAALLSAWWALASALDRWAAGAFARPAMASALVTVIEVALLLALSCAAPPLSAVLNRLFGGRAAEAGSREPSGPVANRAMLAILVGGVWLTLTEVIAVARSSTQDAPGPYAVAVLVASAGLIAAPAALAVGIALRAAAVRGPATPWTVGAWLAIARAPIRRLVPGLVAAGAVLGGLTLLRARLLDRPQLAAVVDVLGLTGALAIATLAARFRAPEGRRIPRRMAGIALVVAALGGGLAASGLRPGFLPSGLWTLTLLGVGATAAVGLALSLPAVRGRIACGALGLGLLLGLGALTILERDAEARDEAVELRPAVWLVAAAMELVDADGDGFSPLFGGGDCNDDDPRINPNGLEIPGNGISENCSGTDAAAAPPWPPRPTFVAPPDGFVEPRSVLVIMVDTLRRDRMGIHGYARDTTPNLDRFARGAIRFDRAYSTAPSTSLAVPSLFTGRTLGEIGWDRSRYPFALDPRNVTLAEIMRDAGFETAAFAAHRFLGPQWGFMQGFEHLDERQAFAKSTYRTKITGEHIARAVVEWMEANDDERFLAFAHFFDPHDSYLRHADGTDFGDSKSDLYDGEIEYTDRWIQYVLDGLERLGIADSTAVVFLSDHGELFGEHGMNYHGGTLVEEVTAIPLMMRVPGLSPRVVDCVTPHNDIAPTVLNLVGIDGGQHGMTTGSLLPELTGAGCDPERETVLEIRYQRRNGRNLQALVGPRWKLVHDLRAGTHRLYDLQERPRERINRRKAAPATFDSMRDRLDDWAAYYANRELTDLYADAVFERLPEGLEPLSVRFANGMELAGMDFGTRRLDVDNPINARLVFRRPEALEAQQCTVRFDLFKGGKRAYGETHPPLNGVLPVARWPADRYIVDHFVITKRRRLKKRGRLDLRLSMTCDGESVAIEGGQVDGKGRLRAGHIRVQRTGKRGKKGKRSKGR